ncbi:MAG TPA: indole-3-glycerol phosphate synthase TrpC [Vicinamibacterales bacterium]|jgi:indole-3-glycerol phosphate synthase
MIAPPASPLAPPDLLATITAAALRVTEVRAETIPLAQVEAAAAKRRPDGAGFLEALRDGPSPRVIAECKRRSPSRGILRQQYDAAAHARGYAEAGAAAISVLTEPTFFDGALEHLAAVRSAVRIPILRKDFIVTRYQVYEAVMAGADAVLLIVGALTPADLRALLAVTRDVGAAALVEAHDETELAIAADSGAEIVGLNSRNLRTLAVEPELHERLAPRLPTGIVAVAESGLRETSDLSRLERAGYHAFLVGERLIVQPDPGAALRLLRGVAA